MFKKYPFVKQEGLKDCAAASVSMIVKYYGGYISITKLNEMLKTNRNGTTAYHIVETLKKIGFDAKGIKTDKLENTKVPFIANVLIENSYKHFLVVYEINSKYVLVADPANKLKRISHLEFSKIWTGVKLVMHPIKPIIKQQNHSCFKFIIKLITPYKLAFIKTCILSVVITFSSIISSFFFQSLIDGIDSNIMSIGLIFSIIFIIKIISDFLRNRLLIKLTSNLDKALTLSTFKQIIELPYIYYHNHTTGEIISRINDLSAVRDMISKVALTIFIDLPLTLFSMSLLLYINKFLFIIVIIILSLYLVILISFKNKIKTSIEEVQINKAEVNSYMVEVISGFETVKGLDLETKMNSLFKVKYQKLLNSHVKLDNTINCQLIYKDIINVGGQVIILLIGVLLVKEQALTLGTLITYNILVTLFLEPIKNVIDLDFEIKEALNALKRVLDLFEEKTEKIEHLLKGPIELRNISFSFDGVNKILKNVNLKINPKEKVLITGRSGSGKSTLLKILKGYYSDYNGQVIIGGKKANKIKTKAVYLTQKEILFTGTIDYNLKLKGSRDLASIKDTCYTDEIAMNNELKYNMLLEEDGFNISGGQRQRIALARALHNFDILIIDEGLSGLDINLERKIIKKLFHKYHDKIIIVISHRLDNLDLFDRFIKLEDGKVMLNEVRS